MINFIFSIKMEQMFMDLSEVVELQELNQLL